MDTKTRFAIRLVHFNAGWRYWAFDAHTGYDEEYGLSPNGYGTREEAEKSIQDASH
jgi:hypothetical protein